jgi:SOS-response transcriptional repressor LexA
MQAIMHDAPAVRKCLLHHGSFYLMRMNQASDRLKAARIKARYPSAKAAAEAMGIPVATYIQHENGGRGIPAARAEKYARFFHVTPEWLLYGTIVSHKRVELGPQLYVIGEVAAGDFKEAWKMPADEWLVFTGRRDIAAPIQQRFGLKVTGESMNELYPDGTILECVEYHGRHIIPSGKRVVVQRTRADGKVEATVKQLVRKEDGSEWLVPRSSDPSFQSFRGDQPDSPDITKVEIIGIVVASTRLE